MIGRTLGHHRVCKPIGARDRGVAWRACDEHLTRDVALWMRPVSAAGR